MLTDQVSGLGWLLSGKTSGLGKSTLLLSFAQANLPYGISPLDVVSRANLLT